MVYSGNFIIYNKCSLRFNANSKNGDDDESSSRPVKAAAATPSKSTQVAMHLLPYDPLDIK